MDTAVDPRMLLGALRAQLECDEFLGGRWLPIGPVTVPSALPPRTAQPVAVQPAAKVSKPSVPSVSGKTVQPPATGQSPVPTDNNVMAGKTRKTQGNPPDVVTEKRRLLAEVEEELRTCHKCPLAKSRKHLVPGEGHPDARIMFVGEAPGQTEDETGRPFVGRAGQLLTNIIEAMGLKREDVFICNILKCRPPGNRDPLASEIAECIGYLYRQIEIIRPDIIVALGKPAAQTLLQSTASIGELRGRIQECYPGPMTPPIKLMATYHPAYLLRNYTDDTRRRVWLDMQMVLKELGLPIPVRKGS
jgi:uracil-DNA glycosylase